MKARVFSFVFALIALFAFNNAFAQGGNPHFVGDPCYTISSGVLTISGKVAGLGNNRPEATITVSGEFSCSNPTGKEPTPWQDFEKSNIRLTATDQPGVYDFSATVKVCNRNWTTTEVRDVEATIIRGSRSYDPTSVEACQ